MSAPNISLSTGFPPKPFGMIFSLSPFLNEQWLEEVRCPHEAPVSDGQPQVSDAGLEIVLETSKPLGGLVTGTGFGRAKI